MTRMKKAEIQAAKARREMLQAEAIRVVRTGVCPQCGEKLKRNLSLAGWYQCVQSGAEGFRKDASKPSCSFQTFTE